MKKGDVNRDNHHLPSNLRRAFLLLTTFVLFLLPLISAQFGFGYGFSIEGFLDNFLNSSSSTYILFFFILFTVITLILSRLPLFRNAYGQPNAFAAGVVSFSISALAIYYLYQRGFQGESLFSWLGLSGDALSILVLILVLLIAVLMIWKLKFRGFLFALGLLMVLTAWLTELFYERRLAFIIGLALIGLSLWLWWRKRRRERGGGYPNPGPYPPGPQPPGEGGSPGPGPTPPGPQPPGRGGGGGRPRGPTGVARFDLILGGQNYANPQGTFGAMDLRQTNRTEFYIRNGGTGGVLTWKAAASKGLAIGPSSGSLSVGKGQRIEVGVTNRNVNFVPHITIFAKRGVDRGARSLIREAVGKVILPFRVN